MFADVFGWRIWASRLNVVGLVAAGFGGLNEWVGRL